MNTKILVTYATMSGSTVEVAKAVAGGLARDGTTVDLQPKDRPNQEGNDHGGSFWGKVIQNEATAHNERLPILKLEEIHPISAVTR